MGLVILIAEDELEPKHLYVPRLENSGHLVQWYTRGDDVIQDVENGPQYHLGIFDASLPVVDGREVSKRLKQLYPQLPIISLSGYNIRGINPFADVQLDKGLFDYPLLAKIINRFYPGSITELNEWELDPEFDLSKYYPE